MIGASIITVPSYNHHQSISKTCLMDLSKTELHYLHNYRLCCFVLSSPNCICVICSKFRKIAFQLEQDELETFV